MFKVGDRVRYKNAPTNGEPWYRNWAGITGTIDRVYPTCCRIMEDNGNTFYPDLINLEHIKMVDTTKDLVVIAPYGSHPCVFVTLTSDGHILVDTSAAESLSMNWVIFDTDGQFVRSNDGFGSAVRLVNKNTDKTLYVGLSCYPGDDALRIDTAPQGGHGVAVVALNFKNGLLIDAKVERANTVPIHKVQRRMPHSRNEVIEL